jgi:hypothetical protein
MFYYYLAGWNHVPAIFLCSFIENSTVLRIKRTAMRIN